MVIAGPHDGHTASSPSTRGSGRLAERGVTPQRPPSPAERGPRAAKRSAPAAQPGTRKMDRPPCGSGWPAHACAPLREPADRDSRGHWSLRDAWMRAARTVGLTRVKFNEATKHTMATAAIAPTRRYAQLADSALVQLLRPPRVTPDAVTLSPTCRQEESAESGVSQLPDIASLTQTSVALPTGVEPVFWP